MVDRDSNSAQFVMLLSQNRGRLFGFIHSLVLNFADAEDLYQQVVVVLWKKFDCFEPGTDFAAWAIRVADFTVKNFVRQRRRNKVLFDDDLVAKMIEEYAEVKSGDATIRSESLAHCLERLPREDRRLVELCYGSNDSIRSIALRAKRTPESLYAALHRIRRLLFECIERKVRSEVHA